MGGGWAGLGSLTITQWLKREKPFKVPRKYGGYFRSEADHRDYVSIGTAAGELPTSLNPAPELLTCFTCSLPQGRSRQCVCVWKRGTKRREGGQAMVSTLAVLSHEQEVWTRSHKDELSRSVYACRE